MLTVAQHTVKTSGKGVSFASSLEPLQDSRKGAFYMSILVLKSLNSHFDGKFSKVKFVLKDQIFSKSNLSTLISSL